MLSIGGVIYQSLRYCFFSAKIRPGAFNLEEFFLTSETILNLVSVYMAKNDIRQQLCITNSTFIICILIPRFVLVFILAKNDTGQQFIMYRVGHLSINGFIWL